ncbi:MAG: hypothetical protein HKN15_13395 [Xanthomonadales bacterium]|nr:hypothetical protein [Xanthomonadales bacterium]
MKILQLLLSILFTLSATAAFAQGRPAHYNRADFASFMKKPFLWENLDDQAREDLEFTRFHPDVRFVPDGWIDDFDYKSSLQQYLADRVQQAKQSGKGIHLYIYADWLESCREFRKTASREDYAELFEGHEIVMLDYGYFAETFNIRFKRLPVLIQVHDNGMIGPENVYPLSSRVEHPAKAFHRLNSFLTANH